MMNVPVEITPTNVVVYPDRARVVGHGRCDLTEGSHKILVGDLPLALDPESVRVRGAGSARVRLRGVDVARRYYTETPSSRVRELEIQIDVLQDQLKALLDKQSVKQASIDHINGLRNAAAEFAGGLSRGKTNVENQTALLRFFEKEDAQLRADLRKLDVEGRKLNDELDKLQRELDELRSARPRQRYEARIEVDVEQAGDFEPEITYVVGQSGWQPLYDIRLVESENGEKDRPRIDVTSLAEVFQNTGQDWPGVQLVLSTARPALNQRVPEITPWYIDELKPRTQSLASAKRSKSERNDIALADYDMAPIVMAAASPVEAETDMAEVEESGTVVTFRVSGRVDIPSDGTPHKTTVGRYEMDPRFDYLTVPRHTDAVYRRAKLTNSTAAPLLPGPINLFVGDEYIGKNQMKYTAPAAELELVLGVEERITIKRELVRRDVDKRLLRDVRQVAFAYEIKVENLLSHAAAVIVQDQYPISRHDQIKVRLDRAEPAPEEQTDLHKVEWRLPLNPEQKQSIYFEYQVEHPREMHIAGLID